MPRAFLTKVGTGFVKNKCDNKGIERGMNQSKLVSLQCQHDQMTAPIGAAT